MMRLVNATHASFTFGHCADYLVEFEFNLPMFVYGIRMQWARESSSVSAKQVPN